MFRYIKNKIKVLCRLYQRESKKQNRNSKYEMPGTIKEIRAYLTAKFENCSNFSQRKIAVDQKELLLAYMEGFIDYERLELGVIRPILAAFAQVKNKTLTSDEITLDYIKSNILPAKIEELSHMEGVVEYLYAGFVILFLKEEGRALAIKINQTATRSIGTAEVESGIRGPKEAFVENVFTNLVLLTNRIKNPDFKSQKLTLGARTNTSVYVCYLKGVAKNEIVNQVIQRINQIDMDGMLDINYISEYISDNPYTFFPLSGLHERPDTAVAQMLEGRVAILCDGSPFTITVPHMFIENLQNAEDYYNKPVFGTFVRIIRLAAFALALMLPGLYVAFLNFEHQVVPFQLLITAAAGQEKIPFTSVLEAFLMVLSFEILREATIRMPKGVGQTVGIVGALVLGEAAVKAGFTSNLIVIILALTAICTYVNTNLMDAASLYRIGYIIVANIFGLAGIVFFSAFLCIHMCSLRSFDVPYMSPLSPLNRQGLKDAILRFPLKAMKSRPAGIAQDKQRRPN